jgi:hypothetical protein
MTWAALPITILNAASPNSLPEQRTFCALCVPRDYRARRLRHTVPRRLSEAERRDRFLSSGLGRGAAVRPDGNKLDYRDKGTRLGKNDGQRRGHARLVRTRLGRTERPVELYAGEPANIRFAKAQCAVRPVGNAHGRRRIGAWPFIKYRGARSRLKTRIFLCEAQMPLGRLRAVLCLMCTRRGTNYIICGVWETQRRHAYGKSGSVLV